MHPEISHVANALYVGAVVLGLPALAGMLFSIVFGVRLWRTPATVGAAPTRNPDAIIMTIEGMARVIGVVAGLVGVVGKVVAVLLAALSTILLAFSCVLFLTGRGLHGQEDWARETAGVVSSGVLLGSLLSLVAVRGWWRALSLLGAGAAGYALVALWHGYPT